MERNSITALVFIVGKLALLLSGLVRSATPAVEEVKPPAPDAVEVSALAR